MGNMLKLIGGLAVLTLWGLLLGFLLNWAIYAYVYATMPAELNYTENLADKALNSINIGAEVKGLEVKEPHGYEHFRVEHQRDLLPEVSNE